MSRLTITQAAKVCGYDRSYFYKVIKQYGITINKDHAGKSYIDASELVRVIPAHSLNMALLEEYTGQHLTTPSHNTIPQETTPNHTVDNEVVELLKKQVKFLEEQLEISQSQVNNLLDTVHRQTLLLENKTTVPNNTTPQKTTQETTQPQPVDTEFRSTMKDMINRLREKSKH